LSSALRIVKNRTVGAGRENQTKKADQTDQPCGMFSIINDLGDRAGDLPRVRRENAGGVV